MSRSTSRPKSIANAVYQTVTATADHIFTYGDFGDLPQVAVSQALSRFCREGLIQRTARGLYYRPRQTVVGQSQPSQGAVERLLLPGARSTGLSAAALLGFSTQQPSTPSYAIPQRDAVTRVQGVKMIRMRPAHDLSVEEGAIIEFVRDRAKWTELDDRQTIDRLKFLCKGRARFDRLVGAAMSEPPRVRAILGAVGEVCGATKQSLQTLRDLLNPTSKFDFGLLRSLPNAKSWQAK